MPAPVSRAQRSPSVRSRRTLQRGWPAWNRLYPVLVLLASGLIHGAAQAQDVGRVEFARGEVSATAEGQAPRKLERNASLIEGETLNTGSKSFAVIRFDDGTRLTLRPQTQFQIERFNTEAPVAGSPQADEPGILLRLFRGGLRAITGLVSQQRPETFRLRTPVATIGIRGTEFSARLCDADCAEDNERYAANPPPAPLPPPVGRVARGRGEIRALDGEGNSRKLVIGSAVFQGDTVETGDGAFAVLSMRDEGRISLQPDTRFAVERFSFNRQNRSNDSALFRLLRGGLRMITGLVGKNRNSDFKMATPVATLGIRGTGFELLCLGTCVEAGVTSLTAMGENGLIASAWEGAIDFGLGDGPFLIEQGSTSFLANATAAPFSLPSIPTIMRSLPAPRPDLLELKDYFEAVEQLTPQEGLYVSNEAGHVLVEGETGAVLDLAAGEGGYVADATTSAVRLSQVPAFQLLDPFPAPGLFDPNAPLPGSLVNALGAAAAAAGVLAAVGDEEEKTVPPADKPKARKSRKKDDKDEVYRGGIYFGLGAGSAEVAEAGSGTPFEPESSSASKFFLGWRLNRYMDLEVASVDLGDNSPTGITAQGGLYIPLGRSEMFTVFAKGGLFQWEMDIAGTLTDDIGAVVGAGLELHLGEYFTIRLEGEQYTLGNDDNGLPIGSYESVMGGVYFRF